ncbi:MAG: hypothetical protein AAF135_08535 [Bacteroidota bacterium]
MTQEIFPMILESVQNDIALIGKDLKVIAQKVIEEGISEYPVFIAAQDFVDIGKQIFDRDSVQLNWFFYVSILEDFTRREIVKGDRIKDFQKTFGDPMERACVFVIHEGAGQFVFVPYDIESAEVQQ